MIHTWTGIAFVNLLAAHLLSDFAFQTRRMVEAKGRLVGLLAHGAVLAVVHAALFLPWLATDVLLVLGMVVLAHLGIDRLKIAWVARRGDGVLPFLIDQAAHVATLVVAAAWLDYDTVQGPFGLFGLDLTHAAFLAGLVAFVVTGGAALVRLSLAGIGKPAPDQGNEDAGRRIGIVERLLVLALGLAGQWAAVGVVFAAKSIARFEELKERPFAEYYLIGTLTSFLVATAAALVARAFL